MVTTLIRINSQSSMFFYYERMNQRLAVLRLELGGVLAIPQIHSNIKLQSTSNKSGGPQEGGRMVERYLSQNGSAEDADEAAEDERE